MLQLLIDYLCYADTSSKNAPCGFLSLSYGFRYLILQLEYLLQSFASHCNVFVTYTHTRLRIHDTHTLTYEAIYKELRRSENSLRMDNSSRDIFVACMAACRITVYTFILVLHSSTCVRLSLLLHILLLFFCCCFSSFFFFFVFAGRLAGVFWVNR